MASIPNSSSSMEKNLDIPLETSEVEDIKKINTVQDDLALQIVAQYDGDETWTEAEEKKILRKIDWALMPILCITYGLQYYDKFMLGQAALFGILEDLDMTTGTRYSFASSIFYLGFIAGAWPAVFIAQRYPIERVASGLVTTWGICLGLSVVCTSYKGFWVQRFFLGFLESGISPMFMLIVGGWYKKNEQAFRMGMWYSLTGYSGIVSLLLNYGIGQIKGSLSSWKYMYLVASSITILWGIALWFVLPADPIRARGFDERQRYIAVARLRTNNTGVRNTHFKKEQVLEALLDIKFWIAFSFSLLTMIGNGPITTFLPIIVKSFGFSSLNSLLLYVPTGAYGGTITLLMSYLALKNPGWGRTLQWAPTGPLLFACYIMPSLGPAYAIFMSLQIANTAGYTKRSVTSAGMFVGYCVGNVIGPLLFKAGDAPRYYSAWPVVLSTSIAASIACLLYRLVCIGDNRRRDRKGIEERFENAFSDDLTDLKNPQFRYKY